MPPLAYIPGNFGLQVSFKCLHPKQRWLTSWQKLLGYSRLSIISSVVDKDEEAHGARILREDNPGSVLLLSYLTSTHSNWPMSQTTSSIKLCLSMCLAHCCLHSTKYNVWHIIDVK